MGNTLGAMVFLAAATWLGWTVVRGRAQQFLANVAGSGSGTGAGAGRTGDLPNKPASVHGPLAGVGFNVPSSPATVFSGVFGQNGSLYGPNYDGAYGPYSPTANFDPYASGAPAISPGSSVFGVPP